MPYRPKEPEAYRDAEWLEKKYHEDRMSTIEIAEVCDCSKETIRRWLNRHEIEIRSQSEATKVEWEGDDERRKKTAEGMKKRASDPEFIEKASKARRKPYVALRTTRKGYVTWKSWRDEISVHRLLAVAEYGIEAVKGNHVHHRDHIPWDNRPANIELLTPEEHTKHHHHGEPEVV